MIAELKKLLGSDWTWVRDPWTALETATHQGGLNAKFSYLIEYSGGEAKIIADALLDAVEDGIKGEVNVMFDRSGTKFRVTVMQVK